MAGGKGGKGGTPAHDPHAEFVNDIKHLRTVIVAGALIGLGGNRGKLAETS